MAKRFPAHFASTGPEIRYVQVCTVYFTYVKDTEYV